MLLATHRSLQAQSIVSSVCRAAGSLAPSFRSHVLAQPASTTTDRLRHPTPFKHSIPLPSPAINSAPALGQHSPAAAAVKFASKPTSTSHRVLWRTSTLAHTAGCWAGAASSFQLVHCGPACAGSKLWHPGEALRKCRGCEQ